MSKVTAYYHIVFCTKERKSVIPLELSDQLYKFITKTVTDERCKLIRIGGIQNHVHMLIDLHPSIALAGLMEKVKSHSSGWLNRDARFQLFEGWGREYFAASISATHKDAVVEYIDNQHQHHLGTAFDDEIIQLYHKAGQVYDDRDLR